MTHKNYDEIWCEQVVERLIENGLDHFFIAPGSRSTAFVLAAVANLRARLHWGIDERSVAFMALGYGKRHEKPGVIVTTSGTAVANLYPAVVEAFMSKVPMLLLTADRPAEQRNCGANQVIFQSAIFANHINQSFDLTIPRPLLGRSLAIFDQAIKASMVYRPGPVHVNIQLEEPLKEREMELDEVSLVGPKLSLDPAQCLPDLLANKRGLIVVGELLPKAEQEQILRLSHRYGWPILADITSNMSLLRDENIIHHYDLGLLNNNFLTDLNIQVVFKFGQRIVSKRFWQWVRRTSIELISLSSLPDPIDPVGKFQHYILDVQAFLSAILAKNVSNKDLLMPMLKERSLMIKRVVEDFLEHKADNEAYFANRLIESIQEKTNLFVSSSMPIRDLDQSAMATDVQIEIFANRGASGIDGVISSAVGVALMGPTILLIGDVAFLHDTNGLMLLKGLQNKMLIVVINNRGGGIFHLLPVAKKPAVTPWFDTPHDVCLASLCKAHQLMHLAAQDEKSFDEGLKQFYEGESSLVLEVLIDKAKNVKLHRELYERVSLMRF